MGERHICSDHLQIRQCQGLDLRESMLAVFSDLLSDVYGYTMVVS